MELQNESQLSGSSMPGAIQSHVLVIRNQPEAEWLGEAYLPINADTIPRMLRRIHDRPDCPCYD